MSEKRCDGNVSSKHYDVGGIPVYDIWRAKLTAEEFRGLCKGNILKYVMRCDFKNGVEDLRKARQYLEWLIESYSEEKKDGN